MGGGGAAHAASPGRRRLNKGARGCPLIQRILSSLLPATGEPLFCHGVDGAHRPIWIVTG